MCRNKSLIITLFHQVRAQWIFLTHVLKVKQPLRSSSSSSSRFCAASSDRYSGQAWARRGSMAVAASPKCSKSKAQIWSTLGGRDAGTPVAEGRLQSLLSVGERLVFRSARGVPIILRQLQKRPLRRGIRISHLARAIQGRQGAARRRLFDASAAFCGFPRPCRLTREFATLS